MLPEFDPTVFEQLYEARFAELQTRMHAECLRERSDRDYVLRKRAAIARALEAFTKLSVAGKAEFVRQLNKMNDSDYSTRRQAQEKMFETLNNWKQRFPKFHDCPCCGFRSKIED